MEACVGLISSENEMNIKLQFHNNIIIFKMCMCYLSQNSNENQSFNLHFHFPTQSVTILLRK